MNQPYIEYSDFSGGITDDVIGGSLNQGALVENFVITPNKKLKERYGSQNAGFGGGLGRIGDLFNYFTDSDLLVRIKQNVVVRNGGGWNTILGPNSLAALIGPGGALLTDTSTVCYGEWAYHGYMVGWDSAANVYINPMKVYQDTSGTYQALNAGMLRYPDNQDATTYASNLALAITFANGLKAIFNTHFASVGTLVSGVPSGGAHTHAQAAISVGNATDEASLVALTNALMVAYQAHVQDARNIDGVTNNTPLYHNAVGYLTSTYSFWAGTCAQATGLNFSLQTTGTPDAQNVLNTCVPILNNLKLCFNLHSNSYLLGGTATHFSAPAGGNVTDLGPYYILGYQHYAFVGGFFTADLVLGNKPTFTPTYPINLLLYHGLLDASNAMAGHMQNVSGLSVHGLASVGYEFLTPTLVGPTTAPDTFTLIQWYSQLLDVYRNHLYSIDSGHTSGSVANIATELGVTWWQAGEGGQITLDGIDPRDAVGAANLWTMVKALRTKGAVHIMDGTMHSNIPTNGAGYSQAWAIFDTYQIADISFQSQAYAFDYINRYKVKGAILFEDEGSPYYYPVAQVTINQVTNFPIVFGTNVNWNIAGQSFSYPTLLPRNNPITISNLTALPSSENWPSNTALTGAYRTTDGGSSYFKITEIPTTQASVIDNMIDAVLLDQEVIYTDGGIPDADQPPPAKCFIQVDGTGYFGGIIETVETTGVQNILTRRLRQSTPGDIGSCPATFFEDFDTDIMTLGVAKGTPIVVCTKGVYRIDGTFDETGKGALLYKKISDTVGGVSPNGGATLNDTFYFAGLAGFYMTDGYTVLRISKHFDKSYAAIVADATRAGMIKATIDRKNLTVTWSVQSGFTGQADTLYVLDTKQPIAPIDADTALSSFTRFSNGVHFAPTGICYFQNNLYRGDPIGLVFNHQSGLTDDPGINRGGSALTGYTVHIPYQFRSVAQDFGAPTIRKWVTRAAILFYNESALTAQFNSINDLNTGNIRPLKILQFNGNSGQSLIRAKRAFPSATDPSKQSGGLRCFQKQFEIVPGEKILFASQNITPPTKASITGATVILDTSSFVWPTDVEDYTIAFAIDGYITEYLITAYNNPTTITIQSPPTFSGSVDWQITGIPKNEIAHIAAFSLFYNSLTPSETTSNGPSGGNT
jgi:hypothetical protein